MKNSTQAADALRERMWSPQARWRAIQDTLTWAESQRSVSRCTPEACLARQAHLLAGLKGSRSNLARPARRGKS
ncbi:MAG: hypothetical protein A3K19_24520 [Lentisphaerae bacterium RIFOXYB12_FULL_65_16]|nr:MAG: hypothetical protein A3K18_17430 [Lentisphaerae bacterium RIFOXYA12_64_32]OGV83975.1 MAG: hypothetical protein A3K19_24520 [Lentisphaerae bacterium RIFOXYB12_FULL_65_16]